MQTKFYKGQRAVHSEFGEGVIHGIDSTMQTIPVMFDHRWGRMWFTYDGRVTPNSPVTLRPIEGARTVLTEWQRKRLEEYRISSGYSIMIPLETLESILSEPEPPKYKPKRGEAVLVRDGVNCLWQVKVALGRGYQTYGCKTWNHCRPFDPELVGKITD